MASEVNCQASRIGLLLEQQTNVLIKIYLIFFVKAQLLFDTRQNI